MKDLFKQVQDTQTLQGWCELDKALTLAALIIAYRPLLTVEIGVFGGRSLVPMALAHKAINFGQVIGIDAWSKEVAIREQTQEQDKQWWASLDMAKIQRDFMAEIPRLQLERFVKIYHSESNKVHPPEGIGVLHIDGSHAITAANDMVMFGPKVVRGGFLVTDDSEWHGGGVKEGERRILSLGFKWLYSLGTGQVFQRL